MAEDQKAPLREVASSNRPPTVNWDTSQMRSSYANVCNVASTREEVIVSFGIAQPITNAGEEVSVQLNERLILSPFAAKRLSLLLNNVIEQYEQRFGSLATPSTTPEPTSAANN